MNPVTARTLATAPAPGVAVARPVPAASGFSGVLRPMLERESVEVEVRRGQTLTSIVRAQWAAAGREPQALTDQQAHRWALQVARDNDLRDPNLITPGQRLMVRAEAVPDSPAAVARAPSASARPLARGQGVSAQPAAAGVDSGLGSSLSAGMVAAPTSTTAIGELAAPDWSHPVLGQTLDRAVARGYMPAQDRQAVVDRIQNLADKHGFKPDDFARAVLMESDGLNPRANNGRCFGIIQFCSGPDRGAASAGYGRKAHEILKLSVLQQLDLVDRYFDDTKLSAFKAGEQPVRLDDLYLTILMPAARQEKRLHAALPIPGQQALDLHAQRDRQAPITRQSILSGLYANARDRLGQLVMAAAGK